MDLDQRFRYANDIIAQPTTDATIVFAMDTGRYFALNESASFIWEQFGEARSVEQIAHLLIAEFDISIEDARSDVFELICQLHERGLLMMAGPGD